MQRKIPLWRQTPPAIFPVTLGFMTLALGWRKAADVMPGIPVDIGNLMLGLSTGYFIWFLLFYVAKLAARPAVLFEDMRTPPARAGIAAMAMSMMVLAAALLPLKLSVPQVWWTGVVMQVGASAIVLHAIWKDAPEDRHFTTFQYLTFVGPIVGPIAGVPLGYIWQSYWMTMGALGAFVIITIGLFYSFRAEPMPERMRPSMMIFLAPVCLFALSYGSQGYDWGFTVFYWFGGAVAFVLLLMVPWMLKGGYTPIWAAFKFPLSAFLNLHVIAVGNGHRLWAELGVYAGLVIATPVILYISYRSIMEWVTGDLAQKSGAATA
jgi:tellurite resistance protein